MAINQCKEAGLDDDDAVSLVTGARTYHVVLVHVVPQHFVDAHLKDAFKVRIDRLLENAGHAQLVDIEARRVPIIKDLRVSEAVHRRTVKALLALQASK
jgi:hypothetical protein